MKYRSYGRIVVYLSGLLFLLTTVTCTKDHPIKAVYQMMGNADAALQGDGISSSGFATLEGSYTSATKTLNVTINWTGLSGAPRSIHIHGSSLPRAPIEPKFDIPVPADGGTSGTTSTQITISDDDQRNMLADKWTFQFHTAQYPKGEISGPVIAR